MKKGVVDGFFVVVTAMVFIALLTILGYKFINMITKEAETSRLAMFQGKLQEDVNSVRNMNTVRFIQYEIPYDTQSICVTDDRVDPYDIEDFYMKNAQGTKNNVFVYSSKVPEMIEIRNLGVMVYPFFSCETVDGGRFKLELTGRAGKAFIYPTPDQRFCEIAENSVPNTCSLLNIIYPDYSARCCELHELCC